jgi:hypothetical protein
MYDWLDRVGYTVDRAALRCEFPDVYFHDFESWAKTRDWNAIFAVYSPLEYAFQEHCKGSEDGGVD